MAAATVDRTLHAVRRQLAAMGCERFEVGVRDPQKGMLIRDWTPDEVMKGLAWLRRENAIGSDVYIRPQRDEPHALVLVDDVDEGVIEQMRDDGLAPSAVVETSPKNMQAWVRLSAVETRPDDRTAAARILAERYGGDLNSADYAHFGRLAGLTNRKPEHTTPKGQPFTLLRHARTGGEQAFVPPEAEALLEQAREQVRQQRSEAEKALIKRHLAEMPSADGQRTGGLEALKEWFIRMWHALRKTFGEGFDPSRADWQGSVRAFRAGYDYQSVAAAVSESPGIQERKGGHAQAYIDQTVGKAEVWVELERDGARYEDVKRDLLGMARARAAERQVPAPAPNADPLEPASKQKKNDDMGMP